MSTLCLGRICRICLLESSAMHKLLDIKRNHLKIEEMLSTIVPSLDLSMDTEATPIPVEICDDCWEKLQLSYDFHQLCMSSNERLKHFLENRSKQNSLPSSVDLGYEDLPNDIGQLMESSEGLQETIKMEIGEELVTVVQLSESLQKTHDTLKVQSLSDVENIMGFEIKHIEHQENDDCMENEFIYTHSDADDIYCNYGKDDKTESHLPTDVTDLNTTRKKTCPHCHEVFAKPLHLTRHLPLHSLEHQFVCDICHYRYATEKLLKTHKSIKHQSGDITSLTVGPYECPHCPMIFQQTRALAAHRVMHSERAFECKICGIILKSNAAEKRHMDCKHPGILPYKCEVCEQAFSEKKHFNNHINMHEGCKEHKCEKCDKCFPNPTTLNDHMRSHTEEPQHKCVYCGKCFITANILQQHMLKHGTKTFKCPECPMSFYGRGKLEKHMSTHSREKPFVCDICGSSFTRADSLKGHKFKHSGERPFKCEECNMSFVFKSILMKHKITHTGEKPHMCTYCDRSYAASGDLVKHLRTHLGENTYFCDECPEKFKYQQELRAHKNQHYKEKSDAVPSCEETVKKA